MLQQDEWQRIAPALSNMAEKIMAVRKQQGLDLEGATREAGREACDLFFELTGYRETNVNAIWHHRLADYGPECPQCGHLFRTPKASRCANCGFTDATVAEPTDGTGAAGDSEGREE